MKKIDNTFNLNVEARLYIEYNSEKELVEIINSGILKDRQVLHIGEGSNLLFLKNEVDVVLHSGIKFIDVIDEKDDIVSIKVGSGIKWDDFCSYAVSKGFWGIENLSYIPGEVGASAVQNIGAYGVEVCDRIESVTVIDKLTGKKQEFTVEECQYGYRTSIFKEKHKDKYIVTEVCFSLTKKDKPCLDYKGLAECFSVSYEPTLENIRKEIIRIRDLKLPKVGEIGSAGSFFKNPVVSVEKFNDISSIYKQVPHYKNEDESVKIPAAWLIEQSGMKGKEYKGAAVYFNQPLVLVNNGTATGEGIAELSRIIQKEVDNKFGIKLETEVQFIKGVM